MAPPKGRRSTRLGRENYSYDGTGRRTAKTVNSTLTRFTADIAGNLLFDGTTSYLYGPGGVPVEQVGSTATQWFFSDGLGSTRALVDSSGTVVGGYGYAAYGTVSAQTGTVTSALQYAGQYTDAESGFQYLRARYYDPVTAQFLTVDPAVDKTLSAYGYAADNPLNGTDPSGLVTLGLCGSAAGGLVGGGFGQVCLNFGYSDGNFSFADTETVGGGEYVGGVLDAGLGVQASNAKQVCDLSGAFDYTGGSGGEGAIGSADEFEGSSNDGYVHGVDVGVNAGVELPDPYPFEAHTGTSYTYVHEHHPIQYVKDYLKRLGHL